MQFFNSVLLTVLLVECYFIVANLMTVCWPKLCFFAFSSWFFSRRKICEQFYPWENPSLWPCGLKLKCSYKRRKKFLFCKNLNLSVFWYIFPCKQNLQKEEIRKSDREIDTKKLSYACCNCRVVNVVMWNIFIQYSSKPCFINLS